MVIGETAMTRETFLAGIWLLGSMNAFGATGAADAPVATDWQTKLQAVQSVVRHVFPREAANAHYAPSIAATADLSGTGKSEALVNLGSGGYTDDLTVMRLEGDMPVAARFQRKDEKVTPMVFQSGLSDGKGTSVELMPKDHAVFSGHWTVIGVKVKDCKGEAYQWDGSAKNFRFDKKLSKSMTRDFCPKVVAKLAAAVMAPAAPAAAAPGVPAAPVVAAP
jgi:hypothetical protein